MTNPAVDRKATVWLAVVIGLMVMGALLALSIWYLWRPEHMVWARNAYGMADAGAWTGWEAVMATFAYWFFELKGRTVLTVLALAMWIGCVWFLAGRRLFDTGVRG